MTKITATDCVRDGLSPAIQYTPGESQLWAPAGKDERTVILVRNDSGTDCGVTVEAGDGLRKSIGPFHGKVTNGQEVAMVLDSMRFKKLEGENKGGFVLKLCDGDNPESPFSGTATGVKFAVVRT